MFLLIYTAAEEDVAESKITERREHKRRKREQFCDVWCLPNWALYNYTCYRVLPGLRTWVDAEVGQAAELQLSSCISKDSGVCGWGRNKF